MRLTICFSKLRPAADGSRETAKGVLCCCVINVNRDLVSDAAGETININIDVKSLNEQVGPPLYSLALSVDNGTLSERC